MLINGKKTKIIPAIDRGIQFGDGCFTTATISQGKIIFFSEHIKRLRTACERLNIPFSHWRQLATEMELLASNHKHRAVLKVIITRGLNKRSGYRPPHNTGSTRIVYVSPWPFHYDRWREKGITLAMSPIPLGRNPYLAGLKHLNRLEQVLISAYLEQIAADEVLVLDSEGWIIECCTANVFWRKKNIVYTPRLDQAGVNGIMRQFCIRMLALSSFRVNEIYAREEEFLEADEVVICNALMPIIPVRSYGKKIFASRKLFEFLFPLCKT